MYCSSYPYTECCDSCYDRRMAILSKSLTNHVNPLYQRGQPIQSCTVCTSINDECYKHYEQRIHPQRIIDANAYPDMVDTILNRTFRKEDHSHIYKRHKKNIDHMLTSLNLLNVGIIIPELVTPVLATIIPSQSSPPTTTA